MKKLLFTLIFFIAALGSYSQSNRMLLAEEFTNATFINCGILNPPFDALMQANPNKIVTIKYHTNYPGADPMNSVSAAEVNVRHQYYQNQGVPGAFLNGANPPVIGTNFVGSPANFTQSVIDNAQNVPSPFNLNLSHTFSSDLDSITVSCTITAVQAVNTPQMFLRIAMIEKFINYITPPGNSGETQFYHAMRQMVPQANGTQLPAQWSVGQTQSFTFSVPFSNFIFNPAQIAFVGFIQEDAGKTVQQAAYSAPQSLTNYVMITDASPESESYSCAPSVTPSITIKNLGNQALTNATVRYVLNSGATVNIPFVGNVQPDDSAIVPIPTINAIPGQNSLAFTLVNLNNSGVASNTVYRIFYNLGNTQSGGFYTENFTNTAFPYTNWVDLPNSNIFMQNNLAGFGTPKGALKLDFWNTPAGGVDEMLLPAFNFSGFGNATLTFKVAAKGYLNGTVHTQDTLAVLYSTNCGNTWNIGWLKAGANLATGSVTTATAAFGGTADSDFRNESVVLQGTANASHVLIKFVGISDYGNNAYIDNINISAGIPKIILAEEFSNASNPGCANQNPSFNAVMAANPNKIITLKYQTSYPGADPMNAAAANDVLARQNYYSLPGVPFVYLNGDTSAVTGAAYTGAPLNVTQNIVDSVYAASNSQFSLSVNHNISQDLDSIYVSCTITAITPVSIPQLSLRMAMIEKSINYLTPPGSNGETQFYHVLRQLIPSPLGASMPASFTAGQSQTLTYGRAFAAGAFNPSEIAVVAFLQEDVGKTVMQTAISQVQAVQNLAVISSINTGAGDFTCNTSISPSITITNNGSNAITSFNLLYSLLNSVSDTLPYSVNILPDSSAVITLPVLSNLSVGQNTLGCQLLNINNSSNNSAFAASNIYVAGNPQAGNAYTENFTSTAFPYANWININSDAAGFGHNAQAGFGNPKGALKMDFWNSTAGNIDQVILPAFSYNGFGDATLSFKIAAKGYLNNNVHTQDTMAVLFSTNCGTSWNLAWLKAGAILATGTTTTSTTAFTGTLNTDYRDESVVLTGTSNASQVLLMFYAISDYGNNAYIDNINLSASLITSTVSAEEKTITGIFPNPANTSVNLIVNNPTGSSRLELFDAVGRQVWTEQINGKGNQVVEIATGAFTEGLYFVKVNGGVSQKLIIRH